MSPHPDAQSRARLAFAEAFGREPEAAAFAPGRVNIIGEHVDYCGGSVLPVAIDRVCVVAASKTRQGCAGRVVAADVGETWEAPADWGGAWRQGVARGSWRLYVGGVCALIAEKLGCEVRVDLAIAGDVPRGAGLSSSAALEVAAARAVLGVLGREGDIEPLEIAHLCQRAEHEYAGVPCGLMDQAAAVLCRRGEALLLHCREPLRFEHVPLGRGADWLVVDTGVRHVLASGEYAARRAACESAARKMGVEYLCDAAGVSAARTAAGALSDAERRAMEHAMGEQRRVLDAVEAIRRGDMAALGRLLYASHASLRDVLRVSCEELDMLVDRAARTPGVLGARLVGGGFGGSVLVLAESGKGAEAGEALRSAFRERFGRECAVMELRG